jgi:WXG100 family type VII secretion target
MGGTPDDGTITYDYSQCQTIYEELVKDQATIGGQIEALENTISNLMNTWTGMSADQWQSIQAQFMTAIGNMAGDLNKAANLLPEMASNMQYADRSAAARIASIGRS